MILQYRVREFVVNSKSVGDIGALLVRVRRKMKNHCTNNPGPFVGWITAAGNISMKSIDGLDQPLANSN